MLDAVDLRVAPGEFVCLLGASGCGKSTLLALIGGLDTPNAGEVRIDGGRPAFIFQEPALLPWLTASRNVELALRARGVPARQRRPEAERLLETVHLHGRADARVHELSGGMRQRVAIARALAQDSHVLLMDEPFAALDAITRDALHTELERLWSEQGLTIVFVTHDVREAVRLGSRIILMGALPGRFVAEWPVDLARPREIASVEVAELAGTITDELRAEIRARTA